MTESPWPNFAFSELKCKCGTCKSTGREMAPDFMAKVQALRSILGRPMVVTSAYRCPGHPEEREKTQPGEHTTGRAIDIACDGKLAHEILSVAFSLGFRRIGVSQRAGKGRFVHLGDSSYFPGPTVWTY